MHYYEKMDIVERIKLITTHNRQNSRDKRIIKVAQQIKSNIGNEGKIWAIKKKVQRKNLTTQR